MQGITGSNFFFVDVRQCNHFHVLAQNDFRVVKKRHLHRTITQTKQQTTVGTDPFFHIGHTVATGRYAIGVDLGRRKITLRRRLGRGRGANRRAFLRFRVGCFVVVVVAQMCFEMHQQRDFLFQLVRVIFQRMHMSFGQSRCRGRRTAAAAFHAFNVFKIRMVTAQNDFRAVIEIDTDRTVRQQIPKTIFTSVIDMTHHPCFRRYNGLFRNGVVVVDQGGILVVATAATTVKFARRTGGTATTDVLFLLWWEVVVASVTTAFNE